MYSPASYNYVGVTALLVALGAEDDELDATVERLEAAPHPHSPRGMAVAARAALNETRSERT